MIFLGIDPGLATVGYGIVKKESEESEIVDFGIITTSPKISMAERLSVIRQDINEIVSSFNPLAVGIEQLFFTNNAKTAIFVAQARGVILEALYSNKIEIFEFTPLEVKREFTGDGRADKRQIQEMLKLTFGLKYSPKQDDASDALAIALLTAQKWDASHRL